MVSVLHAMKIPIWLTPLTPMSVVTEKKMSIGELLNWSNTNCPKEHIKNSVADSKENY